MKTTKTSTATLSPVSTGVLRIGELDGLRGVGCAFVVVMHANFHRELFWCWSWVDMFFVLSGFLITTILIDGPQDVRQLLKSFWMRRVFRIWPVYYLSLAGVLAIWFAKPLIGGSPNYPIDGVLPSLFYLQFTDLYLAPRTIDAVLASYIPWWGHSWSLAVEEQYYMLWPFVVLAFRRHVRGLIVFCLLLMAVGMWGRLQGFAEYILVTRIDGLALGSIMAVMLHPRYGVSLALMHHCIRLALMVSMPVIVEYLLRGYWFAANAPIGLSDDHPYLVPAFALFYFGLIGLIITSHPRTLRWLAWRPLTHLGQLSYSIYIVHLPIAGVLGLGWKMLGFDPGIWVKLVLIMLLSWLTAEWLRVFVERPMARLKKHFPMVDTVADSAVTAPAKAAPVAGEALSPKAPGA
ncbi:MAG TPA: acyltransferase [Solimonas sp.]|nr:acyltransferase [Solimonas sp.]